MPYRSLLAALMLAAVTGPATEAPESEPPRITRYPAEAWRITSQFGSSEAIGGGRREKRNEGVDIIARVRTPVYAAAHGVVTLVATEAERGRVVEISLTGADRAYRMVYSHLYSVAVAEDDAVRAGQPVGAVGDTGRVPRGIAFLHFEFRREDGRPVNPELLLRSPPDGMIECVDPERAAQPPEAGGYAPDRFAEILQGYRNGAPLLYPVACTRG
jgi:murein DD-endopeptidase MepM/ murein hydrolase activator NlpD